MKRYCILIIFLCLALCIDAQVRLQVNGPQVAEVDEPFKIAYTVNTQEGVKNFKAPAIKGFNLIAGPYTSQMQSYSIVNGKSSSLSSITYTLTYIASATGKYTVAPASVEVNGQTVTSGTLQIQVTPATASTQGSAGSNRGSGSNTRISQPSSPTKIGDNDLFILTQLSKTIMYEQEAFLLTYKLYSLVDIRGFNNVKLPDFKGFHSQEIVQPQSQTLEPESYNGRTYGTAIYRQFVLFPQKSGKLTIPSAQFEASVSQRTVGVDDLFDAMLNGTASRMVQKTLRTKDLTVDVLPLPDTKPEGYTGGVGQLEISSFIKSDKARTGDAVSLKLTIFGTGNLKLVTAPPVDFPKDFDVYDPKVSEDFKPSAKGMTGKKVFEILAIPRNTGTYTIPAIKFSYFNPQTKSYKTLSTQPFTLHISQGKGGTSTVRDYTEAGEVVSDIRYIKKGQPLIPFTGADLWGSTSFWLAYLLPLCVFITLLTIYRKRAFENANIAYAKEKRANKAAIRRLKTAKKFLQKKQYDAFYDEVIRALWGYVSDKLTIPTSELTKENVAQKLSEKGVGEETTTQLLRTLGDCEFAKYAPGDKNEAMDQMYTTAINTITRLANEIKR